MPPHLLEETTEKSLRHPGWLSGRYPDGLGCQEQKGPTSLHRAGQGSCYSLGNAQVGRFKVSIYDCQTRWRGASQNTNRRTAQSNCHQSFKGRSGSQKAKSEGEGSQNGRENSRGTTSPGREEGGRSTLAQGQEKSRGSWRIDPPVRTYAAHFRG